MIIQLLSSECSGTGKLLHSAPVAVNNWLFLVYSCPLAPVRGGTWTMQSSSNETIRQFVIEREHSGGLFSFQFAALGLDAGVSKDKDSEQTETITKRSTLKSFYYIPLHNISHEVSFYGGKIHLRREKHHIPLRYQFITGRDGNEHRMMLTE